jgi:serine/threonine protein kinase
MKSCTRCQTTYPGNVAFCPRDGTALEDLSLWQEGNLIRGRYRLLGKVGQGGMGAVYKARHVAFGELRALKVINEEFARDEIFVKRFRHEAVLARKLQHANAVRVDDIDEAEDGRAFIVMEFIEGPSLKSVAETAGALPVERVCLIARQVASALDAAHQLGMVHRDIKPANIVLVRTGQGEEAKVLDFGIAKLKETRLGATPGYTLTGAGMVIGTPQYMSPEQALGKRGDELDGRSDLYSLGIVMYQMLTGSLPFKADTTLQMLMDHIHTLPKPIQQARPDLRIPDPVARVVMSCLEKRPELRPMTAQALIQDIERAQTEIATAQARRERLAREQAEAQRVAKEEQLTSERADAEQRAREHAEAERLAKVAAEQERLRDSEAAVRTEVPRPATATAPAGHSAKSHRLAWLLAGIMIVCLGSAIGAYYWLGGHAAPFHTSNTKPSVPAPRPQIPASAPTSSSALPQSAGGAPGSFSNSAAPSEKAAKARPGRTTTTEMQPTRHSVRSVDQQRLATLIRQGDRYLDQDEYAGAIRDYTVALRLDPKDTALRAKLRGARRLAELHRPITQPPVTQPSSAPASLLPKPTVTTGSVRILSSAGAQIYIDNNPSPAGNIGSDGSLLIPNLRAGNHHVRLALAGYQDWNSSVNVQPGETALYPITPHAAAPKIVPTIPAPSPPRPQPAPPVVSFHVIHLHQLLGTCSGTLTIGNGRIRYIASKRSHSFDVPVNSIRKYGTIVYGANFYLVLPTGKDYDFRGPVQVVQALQQARSAASAPNASGAER